MGSGDVELIIIGSGGFSREAADAVRARIDAGGSEVLRGFVDDDPARGGTAVDGVPVLGTLDCLADYPDAVLVVGTGRPDNYWSRLRIVERLGFAPRRYATVVHPGAVLSATTTLGAGTVVLATVVTTASVRIRDHVAIMPGAILTHDDVVDDYATITAGVRLGGSVHVGEGAYIGAGAMLRQGLSVGPWAMIGMGSVVTHDVPAGELWLGVPARYARPSPAPADLVRAALQRQP